MSEWELDAVPAEQMALWCEVLRDDNAIHVDPAVAEALGFGPRTVNPGPINLAYMLNMVMEARPDAQIRSVEAALLGNVLAGDSVRVRGSWDDGGCDAELMIGAEHVILKARIELDRRDEDDGEGVLSQRL